MPAAKHPPPPPPPPDSSASQVSFTPPLLPLQVQVQLTPVLYVTEDAVPEAHKADPEGAVVLTVPFAVPQTPFVAHEGFETEQVAVEPPLEPSQDHVLVVPQTVLPLSEDGVPLAQFPDVVPHTPFVIIISLQVQDHGPLPEIVDGVP